MTNGDPNISDILDSVLSGMNEEELVFDEADAAAPPAEAVAATPAPKAKAKAPRRGKTTRKTDAGTSEAAPAPPPISDTDMAEFEAMAAQLSAETAPAVPAEEPAGAPAPFPPRGVEPAGSAPPPPTTSAPSGGATNKLLLAIVALALFTSLLSVGGLIAVGRTLAHANAEREAAAHERELLARVPALVAKLDDASARADQATAHLAAASPSGPPVSINDLHRELDALRVALAARQPDGMTALNGLTRDGFAELSARLDRIQARLDGRPAPRPQRDPSEDDGQ